MNQVSNIKIPLLCEKFSSSLTPLFRVFQILTFKKQTFVQNPNINKNNELTINLQDNYQSKLRRYLILCKKDSWKYIQSKFTYLLLNRLYEGKYKSIHPPVSTCKRKLIKAKQKKLQSVSIYYLDQTQEKTQAINNQRLHSIGTNQAFCNIGVDTFNFVHQIHKILYKITYIVRFIYNKFKNDLQMNFYNELEPSNTSKPSSTNLKSEKQKNCKLKTKKISQKSVSLKESGQTKTPYRWQADQQQRYINFLKERRELFLMNLKDRIMTAIHNLMSQYIPNRTSLQCRSHHQKMMLKYKTIDNIIASHQDMPQVKEQTKPVYITHSQTQSRKQVHTQPIFEDILAFEPFSLKEKVQIPLIYFEDIESYQYDENFSIEFG